MSRTYLFAGKGALHIQNHKTPYRFHTLCGRTVPSEVYPDQVEPLLKRFKVCKTCERVSKGG